MSSLAARRRVALVVLTILLGLLLSLAAAERYGERRAWQERGTEAHGQLQLYAQALRTLVERFRSVPALLALDSDVKALLRNPGDVRLRQALNERLEQQNSAAGSTVLYLLANDGETLAASNWHDWSSFVGNNYAFRPYFQDAVADGSGRYFAVGVTTGIPGYFLSQAVRDDDGRVLGVVVIKLEMEDLQRDWASQPGVLLVTDRHGVVFLASRQAWRYHYLRDLSAEASAELLEARKYAGQDLRPLTSLPLERIDDDTERVRVDGPERRQDYLWQRLELPDEGWTLHLLHPATVSEAGLRSYRLAAAGGWMTLAFLLLFLAQRRKNQRLHAGIRERLEREVALRTEELRTAQDELVHAARMAALGQMSAALAHELNQPLTAMQMHLGSLRLLLGSGREQEVREGLARLDGLLQRMAALTGHLKTFARKTPAGLSERLDLGHVLEQALQLLAPRMRAERVEVRKHLAADAQVRGDPIRLEQVLLNLLHNALDAMADSEQRVLRLSLEPHGGCWQLDVADSGGGIAAEHLGNVFEPFFTTKPLGEGLGLGLAVSYGIVRELGGSLEVRNDGEGAVFTLKLPMAVDGRPD
jgi:two-component system C4-dicarboxylate transport sensor histidine kinase DctB